MVRLDAAKGRGITSSGRMRKWGDVFLLGLAGIGQMRSGEKVKKTRGIRLDNLCPGREQSKFFDPKSCFSGIKMGGGWVYAGKKFSAKSSKKTFPHPPRWDYPPAFGSIQLGRKVIGLSNVVLSLNSESFVDLRVLPQILKWHMHCHPISSFPIGSF